MCKFNHQSSIQCQQRSIKIPFVGRKHQGQPLVYMLHPWPLVFKCSTVFLPKFTSETTILGTKNDLTYGCLTSIYWQHIFCKSQAIHRSFQVKVSLGILEVGTGLGPVEDTPRGLQEGASQLRTKRVRCKNQGQVNKYQEMYRFFFQKMDVSHFTRIQ